MSFITDGVDGNYAIGSDGDNQEQGTGWRNKNLRIQKKIKINSMKTFFT